MVTVSLKPLISICALSFSISGDLDNLFDQGVIDENLYILMGTAEVYVRPLRDCSVHIALMAQ
jgi:hypothetical protein